MFPRTRAKRANRSLMGLRVGAGRRLRVVLVCAMGVFVLFVVTASARVGAPASASGAGARTAGPSGLVVRALSMRRVDGQIVGAARLVNRGNVAVRSTTGVVGLRRGPGNAARGVSTFSVPALGPKGSRKVRFRTPRVGALALRPGSYAMFVCADAFSQARRFAQRANCSAGGRLAVSTGASTPSATVPSVTTPSGPAPRTILRTGPASVSGRSTAAFRFGASVRGSTFQCSLDGGPWLACASPRRFTSLVDGRHVFAVRAVGSSGKTDRTPAHVSWDIDTALPLVTLTSPAGGSTTNDNKPAFSGAAGAAPGDRSTITVKVFSGARTSGRTVRTLSATAKAGRWSAAPAQPFADGTYTARAERADRTGNVGASAPSTFAVDTKPHAHTSADADGSGDGAATQTTTALPTQTTTTAPPTQTTTTTTTPPPTPPTAGFSVGGTVSGLSGTVVLQDNGGR